MPAAFDGDTCVDVRAYRPSPAPAEAPLLRTARLSNLRITEAVRRREHPVRPIRSVEVIDPLFISWAHSSDARQTIERVARDAVVICGVAVGATGSPSDFTPRTAESPSVVGFGVDGVDFLVRVDRGEPASSTALRLRRRAMLFHRIELESTGTLGVILRLSARDPSPSRR